jgi:hypothetical protein
VVLVGDPGIGKTTLAARFSAVAHGEGATVVLGRCDEETRCPYQPNGAMGPLLTWDTRIRSSVAVETVDPVDEGVNRSTTVDPLAPLSPVLAGRAGSRRALLQPGPMSPFARACACCLAGRSDGWWDVVPLSTQPLGRHCSPRLDIVTGQRRRSR